MGAHLSEEDLILHHYGESKDAAGQQAHLAACAECRSSYESLQQVLDAVSACGVPERDAGYGSAVWQRLQLRLQEPPRRARVLPFVRRVAPFAALAAALLLAFSLGRATREAELRVAQPIPAPARERILLVAVGEHLERSQMVLIELQHATGNGSVDIKSEREWAEQLVPANRLYRQAAVRAGEPGVASVLDDLERVLVEIAASPDQLPSASLEEIRQRIEAQGILFKVRVLGSQVRERGKGREAQGDWRKS
jgi:hypothetical protein